MANFSNLIGAASSLQSGFGDSSSLKDFLSNIDSLGVQITSRYEAVFSAIPQTSFFIQDITTPGIKQNTTNLYFDGKMVEIPQNFEYEHDFSMTIINDSSGYIYSAMTGFLEGLQSGIAESGYTITIKAIGDNSHGGCVITLNNVRIKSVGGLSFSHQGGNIQTFTVGASAVDFSSTPGEASEVGGVLGAVSKLIS